MEEIKIALAAVRESQELLKKQGELMLVELQKQTTVLAGLPSVGEALGEIATTSKQIASAIHEEKKERYEFLQDLLKGFIAISKMIGWGVVGILLITIIAFFRQEFSASSGDHQVHIGSKKIENKQ